MESILNSVKHFMPIEISDTTFDSDLILIINGIFSFLTQMGVGPPTGYSITNSNNLWSEFIGNSQLIESVKTYVILRTKLIFDPPASSTIVEAYNKTISEAEWRLNVTSDDRSTY